MADGELVGLAVFGTGRAGTEIVRAARLRDDMRIVAGVTLTPEKDGRDLGEVTLGEWLGAPVTRDLDAVLGRADVDVVLHAGIGRPRELGDFLGRCADAGKDAITVAGLIHPPTALGERTARTLEERARRGGARLVGTGVNPGLLLDALPAFYGTMVTRIDRVLARRVSDVRHWGDGALDSEVCLGRPPEEVRGNRALSLDESLAAIAEALGISVDRMEYVHEALAAPSPRSYRDRTVEVGQTVGFRRRSIAFRDGRAVVEVEWLAIFCIDAEADGVEESATLRIEGDCGVEASSRGTFFGDPYPSTAARALNAIAPLRALAPGLYRPHDIPGRSVPR
jgi:hypothetical protein